MPPALWPLRNRRPSIEVVLPHPNGNVVRRLIADTGAGSDRSSFQLLLDDKDCVRAGGVVIGQVLLSGAYTGLFNVYAVNVRIPSLQFTDYIHAAGISRFPKGFRGVACFRFLNRFRYGNFGDPDRFGLDQ